VLFSAKIKKEKERKKKKWGRERGQIVWQVIT
jgi:hypothetical protein